MTSKLNSGSADVAPVTLFGFYSSVYVRIVRMVLHEKRIPHKHVEVNPFQDPAPYNPHPFGKVPSIEHDGFVLFETHAITQYLDATFNMPKLQPTSPHELSRMTQIIHIIDSYGYWPMVRQVYGQRISMPQMGLEPNESQIKSGLKKSAKVLQVLNEIAEKDLCGDEREITLADLHLAPMIAYFVEVPEAYELLRKNTNLLRWWSQMQNRASLVATRVTG